jgi:hypothetical protein
VSLDVPYLTAMIDPENDASIRLRRLGMAPLRSDVLLGDAVVVFSLKCDDWSSGQAEGRNFPLAFALEGSVRGDPNAV